MASVADLQAAAENYVQGPVRIDPRLGVPDCAGGYHFERDMSATERLRASCPGTDWHLWIPLRAQAVPEGISLRRGQSMQVRVGGSGYEISARAIVQSFDRRDGIVVLKNVHSGQTFTGSLQPDGSVQVIGRKSN